MIKQNYELMYLIPLKYSGDLLQSTMDEVSAKLVECGFEVSLHEQFGKLKFAYKIEDQYQGFYFVVEFNGKASEIENLQGWLRLKKEIIRYLIIKKVLGLKSSLEFGKEQLKQLESEKGMESEIQEDKIENNIKQQEPKKEIEKTNLVNEKKENLKNNTKVEVEEQKIDKEIKEPIQTINTEEKQNKTEVKPKSKKITKKKEEKKQDDKISLEEIDKKLDQILDSDIPTI